MLKAKTSLAAELIEERAKDRVVEDMANEVEGLLRSLDEPDQKLDAIWAEEAEKRLRAYRDGRLKGIPMEDVFEEES